MASENNEIGDIVKKCKILLLDIEGTTTSISFVKDKLFPYAEANVKDFLESQWDSEDVKEAVAALRKLAIEDEEQKVEGVVAIPGEDAGKEEQIEGLVKSVKWQMSVDRKAGPLKQLQGLIWNQGYGNGDIKGHVYDDVAPALSLWNSTEGQKVYIYSSGSVQAQKLLFSKSVAGDLLPHIQGHFDTAVGAKQEAASYAAIVEKIGCKPEDILFLTDIVKEAEAARASGLQAALVAREGNAPLPADAGPVLRSLDQLAVSNKRKPEPQEQEVPAKIPKTDVEANVKTATEKEVTETVSEAVSETVAPSEPIPAEEVTDNSDEPEKMDVEEEAPITETATATEEPEIVKVAEEVAVRIETVIEEVNTSNEASDAPVCNVKPIIEENNVKTDKSETEKMEMESDEIVETVETVVEPKDITQEKADESVSPPEETSTVTIQDITNEQEIVGEGIEVIDDVVPVVEEPAAVEMEDLNNVADVLDKECDEILLKVHDVTNLDSIPVKPLLNSIAEEDNEIENGENTNDIVDSILDSEMERDVKLSEEIEINVVKEMEQTKADADVLIPNKENNTEVNELTEQPTVEAPAEENIVSKTNIESKPNKIDESISETVEVVKQDTSAATTEVKNGVMPKSPVDIPPESESIAEVASSDSKTVAEAVNTADTKVVEQEDAKIESEVNKTESEVNKTEFPENKMVSDECKMESDENTVAVVESLSETKENDMETTDSPSKPTETEQNTAVSVEEESVTKEVVEAPLDNKMEEDTVVIEKNDNEIIDNKLAQINEKETEKNEKSNVQPDDNKMESEESVPQDTESEAAISDNKVNEKTPPTVPEAEIESKDNASNDAAMETEVTEKVNGNVNGDPQLNQNGDASKEEELSARLSVENGDNNKEMNGANGNGDSSEVEKGQSDNKETEIPDIKVKTVATDEPRTDPIEQQPVEA